MRVLVIEHHDSPSIGVVGETFDELGVETDVVWGERGDPVPDTPNGHDGLVVLGGAMDALDDERCPYFPAVVRLIREFADADKPVLGICLGSQLIARAYDARLRIGGDFEFGFHPVTPTAATTEDPVLGHMREPIPLFQWHYDHFDLPPGAVRLATGEAYENQSFRMGDKVYATQFHFEVNEPLVQGWINTHAAGEMDRKAPGYREWLPRQFEAHVERSNAFCRVLTRKWVDLAG